MIRHGAFSKTKASYHQEQGDKFSASSCGIEAYETDIILKQESTAKTLEVPVDPFCETLGKGETGSALIRWEAGTLETGGEPIWVDSCSIAKTFEVRCSSSAI
ncbi:hypothetical protein PNOK_0945800 [Pyrrhoderma noxium]|uniref:Uncharacterized protein n=1 Tax=Pyrrhoderma noxium TaxID=2282107 RepID=A0A286U5Q8_9AGAM|nr:hypothetical protein PNOK_0945800 [Pyrrhoderma noxium]